MTADQAVEFRRHAQVAIVRRLLSSCDERNFGANSRYVFDTVLVTFPAEESNEAVGSMQHRAWGLSSDDLWRERLFQDSQRRRIHANFLYVYSIIAYEYILHFHLHKHVSTCHAPLVSRCYPSLSFTCS